MKKKNLKIPFKNFAKKKSNEVKKTPRKLVRMKFRKKKKKIY